MVFKSYVGNVFAQGDISRSIAVIQRILGAIDADGADVLNVDPVRNIVDERPRPLLLSFGINVGKN
jgi:hypothetical protein